MLELPRRSPFFVVAVAIASAALLCGYSTSAGQGLPEGYWSETASQRLLDKTLTIRIAPTLSGLTHSERLAVDKLIEVGEIFQKLYEESRHHQATQAHQELQALDAELGSPKSTQNLLKLYRIFRGPIATTLENEREPFLPVDPTVPGKNLYPWGVTKDAIEKFLRDDPDRRESILHVRSVVRRAEPASIRLDLAVLRRHPTLDTLHPPLRPRLRGLLADAPAAVYYAVPYSIAYPDETFRAYGLLFEAASLLQDSDPEFAQYLRQRARDLLVDDYEAGDAAWVSGTFGKLNATIGAYEVYDDELYTAKAFYAVSLLLRDQEQSRALRAAIRGMQDFEDSLPYDGTKKVREDIPVGVYHVIADFGQARGTNTATILPNESHITRKYGRTILMRYNILTHPGLFESRKQAWNAVVDATHLDDFGPDGDFFRTLWHEIGHHLGPDLTRDGRPVDEALEENSSTFEEMKADLVSLFLAKALYDRGYYDDERLRSVYASGVRRLLRHNRPRRERAYATMQLMQLNYFLEKGLLEYDSASQRLHIHYDHYHDVVASLLQRVLALQHDGDKAATNAFVDRYATWTPKLHETLARKMRNAVKYRYRLVLYAALGE
ncbi:MAG: NUDIX hydrolase [Candidatus Krumholzibacteriia bacterium]